MNVVRTLASAVIVVSLSWAVAVSADDDDPSGEATPREQETPHERRTPREHPTPNEHPTPHERQTPGEHDRTPSGQPTPADCTSASAQVQAAMDQCPCDADNHGQYVSCVSQALKQLDIPRQCRRSTTSCAGHSTCGRTGAVTCQRPKFGACDTASGTCIRGTSATGACTTRADCLVGTKCSIMSSADKCIAAGGSPGTGSCCTPQAAAALQAPTPTATPSP